MIVFFLFLQVGWYTCSGKLKAETVFSPVE